MARRLGLKNVKHGQLRVYWGREPGCLPDVIYHNGDGTSTCDLHLLHHVLGSERMTIDLDTMPSGRGFEYSPSLFDELERRGYDLTTMQFTIQKKTAAAMRQERKEGAG